jgi:hypothetical protein
MNRRRQVKCCPLQKKQKNKQKKQQTKQTKTNKQTKQNKKQICLAGSQPLTNQQSDWALVTYWAQNMGFLGMALRYVNNFSGLA